MAVCAAGLGWICMLSSEHSSTRDGQSRQSPSTINLVQGRQWALTPPHPEMLTYIITERIVNKKDTYRSKVMNFPPWDRCVAYITLSLLNELTTYNFDIPVRLSGHETKSVLSKGITKLTKLTLTSNSDVKSRCSKLQKNFTMTHFIDCSMYVREMGMLLL